MNIHELKRRLLPYSGYMKPDEDGSSGTGNTTQEEALDLGIDDQPSAGTSETAAPAPAATKSAAADEGGSEQDAEEGGKGGGHGIPRERMNEVTKQRRIAEDRLAEREQRLAEKERENEELRAQLAAGTGGRSAKPTAPAPAAFDADAAEEQYAQALMEGDTKAAATIRREINLHIENSAIQRFELATLQNQVAAKSEAVVAKAMEAYPWLDQEEGAVALELIEASVRAKMAVVGVLHHVALADAIATIAPRFAPDGTPSRVLPDGGAPVDTRLERANKRGAADSMLQPAAVQAGMGNRATAPKIDGNTKLTEEQIAGSSKAELDAALGAA